MAGGFSGRLIWPSEGGAGEIVSGAFWMFWARSCSSEFLVAVISWRLVGSTIKGTSCS